MAKRRQTVETWLGEVIAEKIDSKDCTLIGLLHLKGIGGSTEEVMSKPIEGGTVNIKELADHFVGRAEGYSQDLPGIQTFKLVAFYGNNQPQNPFHFTTSDGTVMSRSESMMSAHEPTPAGLLGQLMKHNETKDRQNADLVNQNMQLARDVISMCFGPQGLVQQSIRSQLEAVEVVKDAMLDMSRERKELVTQEHKAAQDLQMRKAVMEALPLITNRLTGREVFDEKANRAKLLELFAMKIGPKDLEMLVALGKVSKEEALLISTQFAAIVEEKKKEADAMKQVPTEEGSPQALAVANGKGNGSL
ncbi:MAG TPA: hypothetical protein VF077_09665 [Nitrospiraceae bacterium]